MVATHPEILVRHHIEPTLIWTIVASAVLHVAAIGLVLLLPQRFFHHPPGPVSYTVELIGAREIGGTNLVPGKGGKGQRASAAPKPAPAAKPVGEPESANSAAPEKVNKPEPPVKLAEKAPEPQPKEPKPAPAKEPPPKAVAPAEQKPAPPPPAAEKKPAEIPKAPQPEAIAKPAPQIEKKIPPQPAPKPQAEVAKPAQPEPKKPPVLAEKLQPAARAARPAADKEREVHALDQRIAAAVQRRALDQRIAAAVQRRTLDHQIGAAVRRRAEAAGRAVAGTEATGAGGQGGGPISYGPGEGVGGVVAGAEFIAYYNEMMDRVKASWVWPGGDQSLEAVVSFSVRDTGEIVNVRTVRPSGDPTYDLSVERAVRGANPLNPPPEQYRELFADGVEITFRPEDLRS